MERKSALISTKKEIYKYYNYRIKKYLVRDCRKSKTRLTPQKRQQALRKSQKQILVVETVPPQKKNRQVTVLEKYNIKVEVPCILILWTAYYNNNCYIHYSEKNRSGWFP